MIGIYPINPGLSILYRISRKIISNMILSFIDSILSDIHAYASTFKIFIIHLILEICIYPRDVAFMLGKKKKVTFLLSKCNGFFFENKGYN